MQPCQHTKGPHTCLTIRAQALATHVPDHEGTSTRHIGLTLAEGSVKHTHTHTRTHTHAHNLSGAWGRFGEAHTQTHTTCLAFAEGSVKHTHTNARNLPGACGRLGEARRGSQAARVSGARTARWAVACPQTGARGGWGHSGPGKAARLRVGSSGGDKGDRGRVDARIWPVVCVCVCVCV